MFARAVSNDVSHDARENAGQKAIYRCPIASVNRNLRDPWDAAHLMLANTSDLQNQSSIPANSHRFAAATGCGQLHTKKNKASRHQRPAGWPTT
jgi:hypothetical protein